ncbi:MAG TPA: hypothetical protein VGA07_05900 [Anaerolineales bacterium]
MRDGRTSTQASRHAFRQAPWRLQFRNTGRTVLGVIGLLVLGGVYLAVNAKVARAGRELLVLEGRREALQRANSELGAALAAATAPEIMRQRAAYLSFHPAGPEDVDYMFVEGYSGEPGFDPPRPLSSISDRRSMLSPAYTETLGEWLARWLEGG